MRLTGRLRIGVLGTAAGLALAACSVHEGNEQTAAAEPSASTPEPAPAGVTREEVTAPVAPAPAPVPVSLQTQPGPGGSTVSLNKVAVTGDILTVALSVSEVSCCVYTPLDEVSVIDDATSQRISVLKDNSGNWMAGPLDTNGKKLRIGMGGKGPTQVWFKFPAPPATSKTVSITIPEVAPFDAVPVTR